MPADIHRRALFLAGAAARLLHVLAAVDGDVGASDERGFFGA